jgi:hypothetical protein
MRNLLKGVTVAAALAFASTSQAAVGLVDMSWDACTPIVQDKTTTAPGSYTIFVSVLGIDQSHQGYETAFIYADASGTVPDAWRFDPVGCQGTPYYTIDHLSLAKSCPSFQGTLQSVQVKDIGFVPPADPGGYNQNYMRVTLYNAYPNGGLGITASPAVRYFLMGVTFNHTYSVVGATVPGVSCGNFENKLCFKMIRNYYLDLGGNNVTMDRNVAPGAPLYVTFNDINGTSCGSVPAKAATWGAIKSQYRN